MNTHRFVLAAWRRYGAGAALASVVTLCAPAALASGDSLSLDDAVRLAEASAPGVAARQAALSSAEQAVGPAGALPDPELVAAVENLPVTGDDAFSLTRDFMTMRKLGLMQQFPARAKRAARSERAEALAEREQALLAVARLSVRESVARAWIALSTAEERLTLLRTLPARAEAGVAAANAALSAGRGSVADALAVKAARAALADRIDQAEREVADARSELLRWLPDAGDRPLSPAPDWSTLGFDPDSVPAGVNRHRELLAYDAVERSAKADVALAEAEKRPDWGVEVAFAQRGPQYSNMLTVEFRVGLPIFAGQRQDPTIASKQAALAQLEAEREDARRMHEAELRKTAAAWRSARERVRRYEQELLPLADDRGDAALAAYRGGRGELQAVLSAFDAAIEQRIAYADVRSALGQSWATLRYAFAAEDRP